MTNRTYGYIQSPTDERDHIFSVSAALPDSYKLKNVHSVVDQGDAPVCAAISLTHIINWQERARIGKDVVNHNAIYSLRANKTQDGMIPRQALHALKHEGACGYKIKAYSRVASIDNAKAAIEMNGPLMSCFVAYENDLFWKPQGQCAGGHAVILTGWDSNGFVLQNSWGFDWQNNGTVTLPYEDWKYVMEAWTIMI